MGLHNEGGKVDYFILFFFFFSPKDGKLCRWQLQLNQEAVCRHTVQGKGLFLLMKSLLINSIISVTLNPICFVQHSLAVLMEKMFAASPHFVRCIKPNSSKLPDQVDRKLIMDQVGHFLFFFLKIMNSFHASGHCLQRGFITLQPFPWWSTCALSLSCCPE